MNAARRVHDVMPVETPEFPSKTNKHGFANARRDNYGGEMEKKINETGRKSGGITRKTPCGWSPEPIRLTDPRIPEVSKPFLVGDPIEPVH